MRNEQEIFFLLETITGKYLSTFISIYQPLYLSIYLSIYHIYISIYRSIYLSIYLSIYPSIHLSFYLSIYRISIISVFLVESFFYPPYVSIDQSTYFLLNQLPSYIPTFLSDVTAYLLTNVIHVKPKSQFLPNTCSLFIRISILRNYISSLSSSQSSISSRTQRRRRKKQRVLFHSSSTFQSILNSTLF